MLLGLLFLCLPLTCFNWNVNVNFTLKLLINVVMLKVIKSTQLGVIALSHINIYFLLDFICIVWILFSCRAGLIFYRVGVKGINKKTGKDILKLSLIQTNIVPSNCVHSDTFGSTVFYTVNFA